MRILIANDGLGDAGGVQSYLDAIAGGLAVRGHDLAILHRDAVPAPFAAAATRALPRFCTAPDGLDAALDRIAAWAPDLCFSHNMNVLDVDQALVARWPVIKFMHGYAGTCIGGQKQFGWPMARPCDRRFGPACLALYGPRHCGALDPSAFVAGYQWARRQRSLLPRYRAIVVASEHMKREFVRNGTAAAAVRVNPLFPTHCERPETAAAVRDDGCVAFVGRMTALKGGDLLVDAVALASERLGRALRLLLMGDGPQRAAWERQAARRGVPFTSTGWVPGGERWRVLRQAALLALPSTWPEPFGLVGLEAAALGIPAVAFDVGGVREWLRPGVTGCLASADPPRAATLAAALVDALGDDGELRAMGRRAAEVACEMSLDRHLDRLDDIFMAGLEAHAHPAAR
jgi:glycosyltransferase involved in cell wall biosynthesis